MQILWQEALFFSSTKLQSAQSMLCCYEIQTVK